MWSPTGCHPRVRKGPAAPAGLTSLTCGAALCHRAGRDRLQYSCQRVRKSLRHRQASHLLRPMQSLAIVPDGVTHRVATSACKRASSTSRRYISAAAAEQCHRAGRGHPQRRSQRVRSSMCDGQAAPAGVTSLSGEAAPCLRDGGVDLQQCCHRSDAAPCHRAGCVHRQPCCD